MATITITISGDQDDAVISDLGRFLMRRVPAPAEGQPTAVMASMTAAETLSTVTGKAKTVVAEENPSSGPAASVVETAKLLTEKLEVREEEASRLLDEGDKQTGRVAAELARVEEVKIPTDAELVQAVTLAARALGGGAAGGVPRIEARMKAEYGIPGIMAAPEEIRVRILEDLGKIAEGKIVPPEIVLPPAVKPPTQADVIAAADKALLTALGGERVGKTEAEVAAKRKAINAAVRLHTKATALKDVAAEHRPEVILFLKGIASGEIKV